MFYFEISFSTLTFNIEHQNGRHFNLPIHNFATTLRTE